ncbi:MAG: 50S ribosomal protein L29 [Bacteroidales bacterium]|nr:50S ribosomal protein L29 [Bacteroidales bacterium]
MKNSEIKELTTKEIIEQIEDEKLILVRQRLNHAVSPLDNPNKIVETKRNVARLMTELKQRTINQNVEK